MQMLHPKDLDLGLTAEYSAQMSWILGPWAAWCMIMSASDQPQKGVGPKRTFAGGVRMVIPKKPSAPNTLWEGVDTQKNNSTASLQRCLEL